MLYGLLRTPAPGQPPNSQPPTDRPAKHHRNQQALPALPYCREPLHVSGKFRAECLGRGQLILVLLSAIRSVRALPLQPDVPAGRNLLRDRENVPCKSARTQEGQLFSPAFLSELLYGSTDRWKMVV